MQPVHPRTRHTSSSLRAVLRTVAAALAAAVLLGAAAAGPALASTRPKHASGSSHAARKSHASQASHKGWVKYFIVAPPKNGAKEFLFEIAAATLGQGSKAKEIFNLNKGRLQPGGGRLEDPTTILPGWILILPPNAHGPGVHFGPLPVVKPVPSPSPSSSPSPSPRLAPVPHRQAVTPAATPSHRLIEEAAIGGALVLILLLAIWLLLMRRRKSRNRPRRPDPAGPARRIGSGSRLRDRKALGADSGLPAPPPQATVLASDLAPPLDDPAPPPGDPASPLDEPAPDGLAWAGQPAEPGPVATPACPSWLAPPAFEDLDAAPAALPGLPAMPAIPDSDVPDAGLPTPALPDVVRSPGDEDVSWPDYLNSADLSAAAQDQGVPVAPTTQPGPVGPPVASMAPDVASATADVPPWLADDSGAQAATEPSRAEHEPELNQPGPDTGQPEAHRPETAFSPVALRLLGAQRSAAQRAGDGDVPVQRHEIGFGEDRIDIVLAEAPATSQDSRPRSGHTWLAPSPYLVWAPLPYEPPDGGTAFACLGVGDEGCLFIDLAAAPGAVAIGGDPAAATRLAESIVHQLGMSPASGKSRVVIVGAVVPEPHPAASLSLACLDDLGSVSGADASDAIEIVFTELRSDEDAFALARHVASNERRVVPVVLADLPDAPWSFTARPGLRPSGAPEPSQARSSDALDAASA